MRYSARSNFSNIAGLDMTKTTVEMPPEFTASNCENTASLVQYRIDRCIERDGSREAAIKAGGISLSIGHMEYVVHALTKAAEEIRTLTADLEAARARDDFEVNWRGLQTEFEVMKGRAERAEHAAKRVERSRRYSSEQWAKAGKEALAGDTRNLRNRVELHDLPAPRHENDPLDGSPLLILDGERFASIDSELDALRENLEAERSNGAALTDRLGETEIARDTALSALRVAREAMEPLAAVICRVDDKDESKGYAFDRYPDDQHVFAVGKDRVITAGDLRRARAALAQIDAVLKS